ncbi:hypothetical protein DY000_02031118 [Brassica cretica]|uniref:Uncharacterized protein n=1 Tax=Brassica cretica TaxID=69181 RepID=A0ABQ7DMZ2_BRACR|nr:hypothetical protein DY000_02031118 [Brassica cretica]
MTLKSSNFKVFQGFATEPSIDNTIYPSIDGSLPMTIDVDTRVSIDIDHCFILLANFAISSCVLCLQMTDRERRTKRCLDRPSSSSTPPPPPETDSNPWMREREGELLGTFGIMPTLTLL